LVSARPEREDDQHAWAVVALADGLKTFLASHLTRRSFGGMLRWIAMVLSPAG
jgi:hypothetical protein